LLSEYEFESRRGDYDQRDRDYELERGERYRRMSLILSFLLIYSLYERKLFSFCVVVWL